MTTYCIGAGHTLSGAGSGALHNGYNESAINRAVANALIALLRERGHKVVNATVDSARTQNEYLRKQCNIVNDSGADLFVCIHINSGGGYGCEAYTWNGEKVPQAVRICEELHKIGFYNRGVKLGNGLYVIKHTKMTAILIELFFIDDKADRENYNRHGAYGIAQALLKELI